MLDTHAAEIVTYLGSCKTILRFRTVRSSVHERVKLAVDATFRHHMKLSVNATLRSWTTWLSDALRGSGIPIGDCLGLVLEKSGCWCAELQWPWLRNRLATCYTGLDILPELVWRAPPKRFKLDLARVLNLACDLVSTWGESATVEQWLNACIAVVCDEAYNSSGSDESD